MIPAAFDVAIVGAGHGGAQTAIALRQAKFAGSIALIGDEHELPYQRPPLSKDYLSGTSTLERILIRPAEFWQERRIDLMPGQRVTAVDAAAHRLKMDDGRSLQFGKLVWATGGAPRQMPENAHSLKGVHTVRNRADVDRMMMELATTTRVVVIGGGYIGLEAAASLTKLGKNVTVLEAMDRVLARVAGEPLSRFYETQHRAHGVVVRLGVTIDAIEGESGRVCAVRLASGERLGAEMVIVGIGILPSVEPLTQAGAHLGGNGVLVDSACCTSLPDVYAIGDCAAHPNEFAAGSVIRLESVQNATDQATVVGKTIAGQPQQYLAVPWFWSDQYDLKLQTVGLSSGYDDVVVRGDPAALSFSVVYLRRGQVVALDCVNVPRDYLQGRALVIGKARPDRQALADPAMALKSLVSA